MNFDPRADPGRAAAVAAAMEVGLLGALCVRSDTALGHARALGLDPRATGVVLDLLVAVGAADLRGDLYGASPSLADAERLAPGGVAFLERLWRRLPDLILTCEPAVRMDADPASREAAYAPAVERLAVSFGDAATELASALGGAPPSILDVGAGSGVWSLQMARRCAVTRVTALDLPAVLDRFRDRARSLGLADRISAIAGDYHEVDVPPAAYDRVVLANVVHLEPPDRAARLLSRARGWVRPGGEVVVVDALGRPPAEDSATAVYAIHLALRTGSGRVHARAQIEGWLRDAGLATRFVALTAPPGQLGAIVATAP